MPVDNYDEGSWRFPLAQETNSCLVVLYEDGNASVGPHSDNEEDMVRGAPIISLSVGATRKFDIISKNRTDTHVHPFHTYYLASGSAFIMAGDTLLRCEKVFLSESYNI